MTTPNEKAITVEAARRLARMQDDQRKPSEESLDEWLGSDPQHEQHYQRLTKVWESLEQVRHSTPIKQARQAALEDARRAQHLQRNRLTRPLVGSGHARRRRRARLRGLSLSSARSLVSDDRRTATQN
jgi:ferric-dicitrate binding protein FerR (iron transport regulator)